MPWKFIYMRHGSSFIVWKLLYESLCYERRVMCRCSDIVTMLYLVCFASCLLKEVLYVCVSG